MNRNYTINNDNIDIYEPTRNKYMINDSILQHRINTNISDNKLFKDYGVNSETKMPDFGINVGQMGNSTMSSNPVHIENELYGLHNLNAKYQMKKRREEFTPRVKKLTNLAFFERNDFTFVPEPLVIEENQRPIIP